MLLRSAIANRDPTQLQPGLPLRSRVWRYWGADVALVALSETKCHSQKPCCVRVSGVSGVSGVIF